MAWADRTQARLLWADAPTDDATLDTLLGVAQEVAEEFAPTPGDVVPLRYTQAVVELARDGWAALRKGPGDIIGPDDYPIRIPSLSAHVRSLLRPKKGRPRFGGSVTPSTTTILDGGAP